MPKSVSLAPNVAKPRIHHESTDCLRRRHLCGNYERYSAPGHRSRDISVKWEIRPWRLNMLEFTPTADEAMSDAADAHLIVFAIRNTQSLPAWLMNWFERWPCFAKPRRRLGIIRLRNAEAFCCDAPVRSTIGLSFIWEGQKPQLDVGFITEAASTEYKLSVLSTRLDFGNRPNDTSIAFTESTRDAHRNEQSEPLCKSTGDPGVSTGPTTITI